MKKNIYEEFLFIKCMPCWKVLAAIWSSYSVENLLAPASEEENSTMDATLEALKTCLLVCKFLIRNLSRDHFLEFFCKFQYAFKKFG